jgi:hypothetical protein
MRFGMSSPIFRFEGDELNAFAAKADAFAGVAAKAG